MKIEFINEFIGEINSKISETTNYIKALIIVILIQMVIVYNDSFSRPLIKAICVIPIYYILYVLLSSILKSNIDEISIERNHNFEEENHIIYSIIERELLLKREGVTKRLTCKILFILSFFYTFFWSV